MPTVEASSVPWPLIVVPDDGVAVRVQASAWLAPPLSLVTTFLSERVGWVRSVNVQVVVSPD